MTQPIDERVERIMADAPQVLHHVFALEGKRLWRPSSRDTANLRHRSK